MERLELSFHGLCRKYHLLRLLTQSKECWQIRDYSLFVELTFRLFEKRSFLCIFEIVLIVDKWCFFQSDVVIFQFSKRVVNIDFDGTKSFIR